MWMVPVSVMLLPYRKMGHFSFASVQIADFYEYTNRGTGCVEPLAVRQREFQLFRTDTGVTVRTRRCSPGDPWSGDPTGAMAEQIQRLRQVGVRRSGRYDPGGQQVGQSAGR
jgi:hypothetical protein